MHFLEDPLGRSVCASLSCPGGGRVLVRETALGKALFYEGPTCGPGVVLLPFSGIRSDEIHVPTPMWRYVVRVDRDTYLIPDGVAMFANHSCDPNAFIDDDFNITTCKELNNGDEVQISYDRVSQTDFLTFGDDWRSDWSFGCGCGQPRCVGVIDRYRAVEADWPLVP
jgi:hypothetical protein